MVGEAAPNNMARIIELYDTTLRDGTQAENFNLSVDDKIKVCRQLDRLGIDFIEGGWPGSNPLAVDFFRRMQTVSLKHAKLAAFGSTVISIKNRNRMATSRPCSMPRPRR